MTYPITLEWLVKDKKVQKLMNDTYNPSRITKLGKRNNKSNGYYMVKTLFNAFKISQNAYNKQDGQFS